MLTPMGVHEREWASAPYLSSMPCVICQSLMLKTRFASCSSERDGGYMSEMLLGLRVFRVTGGLFIMPLYEGLSSNG